MKRNRHIKLTKQTSAGEKREYKYTSKREKQLGFTGGSMTEKCYTIVTLTIQKYIIIILPESNLLTIVLNK